VPMRQALVAAAVLLLVPAAGARAADPGLWRETGRTTLPLVYFQGVTHTTDGSWLFDGVDQGLWRTNHAFTQTGGNPDVIPPDVHTTEQYNHIGDISFDRAEGGRVILPLECYYPPQGNTCNTGSFGVADPSTLQWRYYVKLDPSEIPKAMWAEVSPDGSLIWTAAGTDLLAYRAADVNPANAAPAGAAIKAVRRLRNAVPPAGITGATFYKGRLLVAGQKGDTVQVWSIDLANGTRRLEIERQVVGESEGLDSFSAAGGTLHWLIQPNNIEGTSTYGPNNATLVHFKPAAPLPAAGRGAKSSHLRISPKRVKAGRSAHFKLRVTSGGKPVRGAVVAVGGFRARTDKHGRAVLKATLRSPGRYAVRAASVRIRPSRAIVRVVGLVAPPATGARVHPRAL
jgi:hypothetical protein